MGWIRLAGGVDLPRAGGGMGSGPPTGWLSAKWPSGALFGGRPLTHMNPWGGFTQMGVWQAELEALGGSVWEFVISDPENDPKFGSGASVGLGGSGGRSAETSSRGWPPFGILWGFLLISPLLFYSGSPIWWGYLEYCTTGSCFGKVSARWQALCYSDGRCLYCGRRVSNNQFSLTSQSLRQSLGCTPFLC